MIAGSSAGVYIFIVAALRLFGKKEIAQLSVVDLVFVLLISNAVQNAMVGPDTSLPGGLCAAGTLFILNYILKQLTFRFPKLSGFVQGQAIVLVYNGEINRENLRKARISMEELDEVLREHNVRSVAAVNLAVLELDGNISVLSDDYQTRSTHKKKDKRRRRT
ncbi:MAG: DUF421 domain-containing protein [Oscillospiraceae bacterium]|jgi:uncharacterized membrane protein YcaP (DUF421 family)|nr:DUF421 domain-containing protein [Oscillospiraceae bacterium]